MPALVAFAVAVLVIGILIVLVRWLYVILANIAVQCFEGLDWALSIGNNQVFQQALSPTVGWIIGGILVGAAAGLYREADRYGYGAVRPMIVLLPFVAYGLIGGGILLGAKLADSKEGRMQNVYETGPTVSGGGGSAGRQATGGPVEEQNVATEREEVAPHVQSKPKGKAQHTVKINRDSGKLQANQQAIGGEQRIETPGHGSSRNQKVRVKNVANTTCPSSVNVGSDVLKLGSGWCYYRMNGLPAGDDFVLSFMARLLNGDGYGIWLNGLWRENGVTAFGVQYDPGAGGIKFVQYPYTEGDLFPLMSTATDYRWHRWRIAARKNRVDVKIDGMTVLDREIPRHGKQFGFRTWRGVVEIRDIEIEESVSSPLAGQEDEVSAEKVASTSRGTNISIHSVPSGANVFIDKKEVGTTPLTIYVEPGSHGVLVKKEGYESKFDIVDVAEPGPGATLDRTFALTEK